MSTCTYHTTTGATTANDITGTIFLPLFLESFSGSGRRLHLSGGFFFQKAMLSFSLLSIGHSDLLLHRRTCFLWGGRATHPARPASRGVDVMADVLSTGRTCFLWDGRATSPARPASPTSDLLLRKGDGGVRPHAWGYGWRGWYWLNHHGGACI